MTSNQRAKVAFIDSANISIQLPQFVWDNVYITMRSQLQKEDIQIFKKANANGVTEIRIYNYNCAEVWQHLKPIEFKLESTVIRINPKGYTF